MTIDKKLKNRKRIIAILTFIIIILFLGIYIGVLYSLVELIPIPSGFSTKWMWYFSDPFTITGACPWGLKILIFGTLMGCFFVGLTIAIYIWKKGRSQFYKWLFGEEIE
ncbi:MAG: hypothetical protein ACTSWR_09810 [Candidatus Helarchaeota archaeon]